MHHVVQENLFNEFGFKTLLDALKANDCEYSLHKVVPFAHTLMPEIDFCSQVRVFVWGSLTLDGIAKERGWRPGSLQNEKFDMRYMARRFGTHFLNHDAVFCSFGELEFNGPMFIRPVHDTKSFTGTLVEDEREFNDWKARIADLSNTGYSSLTSETPVMYASPKKVDFEARFFIVDEQVITGSSYRSFGKVLYQRIEDHGLFRPMVDFVKKMVLTDQSDTRLIRPEPIADGYVLDVAQIEGQYKVIEVNCINSAGFYSCDMNAVVRALEALYG